MRQSGADAAGLQYRDPSKNARRGSTWAAARWWEIILLRRSPSARWWDAMRKRPSIPRIEGGSQTVLLVADVERAAEFYGKCLRLEARDGDPGRYAEFDAGDGGVLTLVKRDGSIAPMTSPAESDSAEALTFSVPSEGYDTWKKWFEKRAVPIERETTWVHGGRSLFVRDPDGRRLEFKTPAAVVPPKPVVLTERKRPD